jgi:hypothetical protein
MTIASQALLKRIATLLMAGGTGLAGADGALELSEEMVEALLDSPELGRCEEADRTRLAALLATDARPQIRQRLAISLSEHPLSLCSESEALLEGLARDRDPRVVRALGAALGSVLVQLAPLERSYLVSSWATADHEGLRFALAFALAWPIESVGVRSALQELKHDRSTDVRTAAARAIRVRATA